MPTSENNTNLILDRKKTVYSLGWERFFKHRIISVVDELDSIQIERGQRKMKPIYEIFDFCAIDRFVLKHFYESKFN